MDSLIQSKLKVVMWNSRSLKSKVSEFSNFLNFHKIDIALISETWLNPSIKISIPDFQIYRNDRNSNSSHPHGGVAICVRKNLVHFQCNSVNLNSIENIFIKVPFENSNLSIGSIYCPPSMKVHDFKSEMRKLLSLPGPIILGGDVNAKHISWNNTKNNYKGIELLKIADNSFYDILSPNYPTLFPSVGDPSTVDLVLKKGIYCVSDPKTINDLSSDHLPVIFQVSSKFENIDNLLFDFKKADWNGFREAIEMGLTQINSVDSHFDDIERIDLAIDEFSVLIKESASSSIPKKKPSSFRYPYSDRINLLKRNRNYYRRMYEKTLNPAFKSCFNQLNRMIRKATLELNEEAWNLKMSNLDFKDRSIYRLANHFKRKKSAIPPLKKSNSNLVYSDSDKSQLLADSFHRVHENAFSLSSSNEGKVNNFIKKLKSKKFNLDNKFTLDTHSLKLQIKRLKIRKAAGFDSVSNLLIRNLPENALKFLIKIFNSCLKISYFPLAWKLGKILALPKPNKDPDIATSYRPITLLSCLGKIFERMILTQVLEFLSTNEILINQQFGFRSGHSTSKQIIRIIEEICFDFNRDRTTGMVFLDVEKAFDSIWHDGLIFKMAQLNFPIHLLKIIQSFLNDRNSFVQINNSISQRFRVRAGVPQGSILSPTLFNIFLNDIPTPPGCKKAIYADDTALKTTSGPHGIKHIRNKLQNGLQMLNEYFSVWKIKLNHSKTEAILFSHSIIINREKNSEKISFEGQILDWKDEVKYLGLILDSRLLFKANTLNNVKKTKKAMSVLFPILKKHNAVSLKIKLQIFKLYLLPLMTYACPAWSNMANCHKKKLQIIQNKILRMVLSAPFATKIIDLHKSSGIPYFNDRIQSLTTKFYNSTVNSKNPLIRKLGKYSKESVGFRIKHRLPKQI